MLSAGRRQLLSRSAAQLLNRSAAQPQALQPLGRSSSAAQPLSSPPLTSNLAWSLRASATQALSPSLCQLITCSTPQHFRWFASERVASQGDKVKLKYHGRLRSGHRFVEEQGAALDFEIGADEVIQGIESAVIGMKVGEKREVEIQPDDAYGPHIPELVFTLKGDQVPEGFLKDAKVGYRVRLAEAQGEEEEKWGTIIDVTEDSVTIDANEPLAGEILIVDLELTAIE